MKPYENPLSQTTSHVEPLIFLDLTMLSSNIPQLESPDVSKKRVIVHVLSRLTVSKIISTATRIKFKKFMIKFEESFSRAYKLKRT